MANEKHYIITIKQSGSGGGGNGELREKTGQDESGAGKEVFPQIIHAFSSRKHNPYVAVNCGAIPEGTIDSELFGHEKGAFTGALNERKGYFEEASTSGARTSAATF